MEGVKLPYKKKSYVKPVQPTEDEKKFFKYLEKLNIVSKTKNNRKFNSKFFFIEKDKNKIRPIFNYKHLKKKHKSTKAYLPSVYQLAELDWKRNMWYTKIDLRQAFFNINIHEDSRECTSIRVGEESYEFNYLPFGLPEAPHICQSFMIVIMNWLKKNYTRCVWGHMDDLLIAHRDKHKVMKATNNLVEKLKKINWVINEEKSILSPRKEITFLGATWGRDGIKRLEELDSKLEKWIEKTPKTELEFQQKAGLLSYYNLYNRKSGPITYKLIKNNNKTDLKHLINKNFLLFKPPKPKIHFKVYADATLKKIGFVINGKGYEKVRQSKYIIENETMAALTALSFLKKNFGAMNYEAELYTDNTATLAFLQKGRTKANWNLKTHIKLYKKLASVDNVHNTYSYVKSEDNPADYFSRKPEKTIDLFTEQ